MRWCEVVGSGYILEVGSTDLGLRHEGKMKVKDDSPVFDLSN